MDSFLERKFIEKLSSQLENFSKSGDIYNFRCPICGDSKKNKSKTRGYLYKENNSYKYKCHNCGASESFKYFLKLYFHQYYVDYISEIVSNKNTYQTPKKEINNLKKEKDYRFSDIKTPRVSDLDANHPSVLFLKNRQIPKYNFHYTDDFASFVNEISNGKYKLSQKNDERIIIPFLNKSGQLIGFQGRTLGKSTLRYITIKLIEDEPMIFNAENLNDKKDFFVFEGPFDSLFIPNSIAVAGSDLAKIKNENAIFVFDNESSNKYNVDRMKRLLNDGKRVMIWNRDYSQKDINEIILSGTSVDEIIKYMKNRIFTKQLGLLELLRWKT